MTNFVCTSPCSKITLTIDMETMHLFSKYKQVYLCGQKRQKIRCISGVQMTDLAPMKNCPGVWGGCKVGQISSLGTVFTLNMKKSVPMADCSVFITQCLIKTSEPVFGDQTIHRKQLNLLTLSVKLRYVAVSILATSYHRAYKLGSQRGVRGL